MTKPSFLRQFSVVSTEGDAEVPGVGCGIYVGLMPGFRIIKTATYTPE
jgi:hypothetical protein